MTDHVAAALARIYRSPRIGSVTFDNTDYSPTVQAVYLAAELGYVLDTNPSGDPEEWKPTFVRNEESAAWWRYWRLSLGLFVTKEAGADPKDVTIVREALGLRINPDFEAEATR